MRCVRRMRRRAYARRPSAGRRSWPIERTVAPDAAGNARGILPGGCADGARPLPPFDFDAIGVLAGLPRTDRAVLLHELATYAATITGECGAAPGGRAVVLSSGGLVDLGVIRTERENCCDDAVVAIRARPRIRSGARIAGAKPLLLARAAVALQEEVW